MNDPISDAVGKEYAFVQIKNIFRGGRILVATLSLVMKCLVYAIVICILWKWFAIGLAPIAFSHALGIVLVSCLLIPSTSDVGDPMRTVREFCHAVETPMWVLATGFILSYLVQ
ncbi:MAG: hypothetical protein WC797_01225 [Candidatus Paceibacterota bacterium]|jgi:hypothetical protein